MKKLIPDENNWKNKLSKFFSSKGFYVVLAVCIIVVAATAILLTTQNMKDTGKIIPGEAANASQDEATKAVSGKLDKTKAANNNTQSAASETAKSTPTPPKSGESKSSKSASANAVIKFSCRPVDGPIMKDFTRDINTFSESKTLGDIRAHDGIDFKVEKLTKVRAVASGTISKVEDNTNGITVEITHSNNLKTRYAGLSKQNLEDISCGLKVKANDIIGLVGDPIQIECEDGPHLHFQVLKNGKSVDPSPYLSVPSTADKQGK
ncbi:M23 family metallopeptidase [Ruminiclostridium cellulolyticum]|uniref:Peptidase M23 n=1 Tax=Ruminiclostridium cellulolyticum (strain ATCC 35319 / DSM 5812 / JCM 6584 / H10) TaxID=394503 RepID=B8I589_RUMCH|nr:M23 family metallopeptidase [Ruminiclostridium cellulolyticum]ACL74669.1 Peptidase M23 [Ruminiclostridium cellulolyticum H10]